MLEIKTASGKEVPEWLEEKLRNSKYQRLAKDYYSSHHHTTHLFIEVEPDGMVRCYDGWEYKRGMRVNKGSVEIAELTRMQIDRDKLRAELASVILFARRVQKQYGWNVVPVFQGYELIIK